MPQYNSGPRGAILAGIVRLASSLSAPTVNATTGTITTVTATTVNATNVDASASLLGANLKLDTNTAVSGRTGPGYVKLVVNSTGTMLAINTTGTTWKYCDLTSILA